MSRRAVLLPLLAVVILVGAIPTARDAIITGVTLLATGQLAKFQTFLLSLGAWAPVVSIALMVTESLVIPVPVTIIMVANGLVFGVWRGLAVSLAGGLIGAVSAYAIGRIFGRPLVQRLLPASSLAAADRLMARYGGWAIVVGHWIPGVPGDPLSYASGLTYVAPARFLLLTTAALVPANLVTAYVGAEVADDVPLPYWLGGIAGIVAIWLIWRLLVSGHRRAARRSTTTHGRTPPAE